MSKPWSFGQFVAYKIPNASSQLVASGTLEWFRLSNKGMSVLLIARMDDGEEYRLTYRTPADRADFEDYRVANWPLVIGARYQFCWKPYYSGKNMLRGIAALEPSIPGEPT